MDSIRIILVASTMIFVLAGCRYEVFVSPLTSSEAMTDHTQLLGEWTSEDGVIIEVADSADSDTLDVILTVPGEGDHELDVRLSQVGGQTLASIHGSDFGNWWYVVEIESESDVLMIRPIDSDQLVATLDADQLTGNIDARGTSDQFVQVTSSSSELFDYFNQTQDDAFLQDPEYAIEFNRANFTGIPGTSTDSKETNQVRQHREVLVVLALAIAVVAIASFVYSRTRQS